MATQVLVDLFSDYCRAKEKEAAETAASSAVDPKPDDGRRATTAAAAAESEPPAKATRYNQGLQTVRSRPVLWYENWDQSQDQSAKLFQYLANSQYFLIQYV